MSWQLLSATFVVLLAAGAAGCERERSDEDDPARAAAALVSHLERAHGDPARARAIYEMLWRPARENLEERARRAARVSGRAVTPEEMLAPSSVSLRFTPVRYRALRAGDRAVVTAEGSQPGERRDLACVLEDGRWRVALDLPPLPELQKLERGDD